MNPQSFDIRRYVSWLTLLPLLLLAFCLGGYFLIDRYVELNRDLLSRGQLLARQLAASSEYGVFSNNQNNLNELVASTLRESEVKAVFIYKDGRIIASSGAAGSTPPIGLNSMSPDHPVIDDGHSMLIYEPIRSAQIILDDASSDVPPAQIGAIIIEMSWEQTKKVKLRILTTTLLGTIFFLLITGYLVRAASRRLIEPIQRLCDAVDAIGAGDLTVEVQTPSCIRELCTLTDGVNQMTTELLKDRIELQRKIDDATEQLRTLAFFDTLTGLPNRRLLNDRLTSALATSKRNNHFGAVLFLDLDNFKPLNDTCGHAVGDLLLIQTAKRIAQCVRATDTIARFGGDEFVVMLSELDEDENRSVELARLIAEKILRALATPYHLIYQQEGKPASVIEHSCTASIGVHLFHGKVETLDTALSKADSAMYQAKQQGRNSIIFYARSNGQT
ncbi:MAG: diguanylate cyclase [Sideroxydans sp.]|jgi:diguanylate cyclase (GGDEF)-like protein